MVIAVAILIALASPLEGLMIAAARREWAGSADSARALRRSTASVRGSAASVGRSAASVRGSIALVREPAASLRDWTRESARESARESTAEAAARQESPEGLGPARIAASGRGPGRHAKRVSNTTTRSIPIAIHAAPHDAGASKSFTTSQASGGFSRRLAPAARARVPAPAAPEGQSRVVPMPAPPAHDPAPVRDTLPEVALVELRLGQIAARTVPAFQADSDALIPVLQFLDLARVHAVMARPGRIEGTMQPGSVPLVIDAQSHTISLGSRRMTVPPDRIIAHAGDVYLSAAALAALLELRIVVNWGDLEVVVPDPDRLPIARQLRRQAARSALRGSLDGDATWHADSGPTRRGWGGFVLDYSVLSPSESPIGGSSYSLAAGTDVLRGSLEVGLQSEGRADAGNVRIDASWLGVWRDRRWIRQLRLGDGTTTGPRPRVLRGISVTNAPFVRPSVVGIVPYGGRLPDGWEVEAYRGGELVAYDSVTSGTFAVDLPMLYGENPVDFVAYGPDGEQRRFSRTYRVESAILPAHRFEYGASGGSCARSHCRATGNLDLRYGLTSRWTANAGVEQLWQDSAADLFHPYAALTGAVGNAWTVQLDAARAGRAAATLGYEPTPDLRIAGSYARFDATTASPIFNPLDRRSQWQLTGFVRPPNARDASYLAASVEHAVPAAGGALDRARIETSIPVGHLRLMPYARLERDRAPGEAASTRRYWGANSYLLPSARWGPFLRQAWLRSAFEAEAGHAMSASGAVARPIGPSVRLEVGASWLRGIRGVTWTLSLATFTRSVRAYTSAIAPAQGPAELTQQVQGSVLYDGTAHSFALAAGPSLQRGGVAGRVFLDLNGNGRFDPGETGLPNVRVQVGVGSAYTDSTGAYRVWDVMPFEPVRVALDSLSFDSPLWVAPAGALVVQPGPNQLTAVDLPLVVGAVLEGTVVRRGGGPVGGMPLVLTERRSGARRTMASFGDGTFYTMGVGPGDWVLTAVPETLDRMGLRAEPVRFTITPAGEGVPAGVKLELVEP
jgi:hypothetical protein